MRIFANAFLVAFAVEAFFTAAGSQLHGSGAGAIAVAQVLFTGLLTLASLPLFVLMGLHPGLRWRIFLPPCLVLSWISMGAMPLPIWFDASDAGLVAGLLEASFAVLAFGLCRQCNGGTGWLLHEEALRGRSLSGRTALGFTALNLFVILPASLAYLALSAAAGVGYLTDGFVEIRGDGIHLSHREYERDGQRIHLVAMMHIGDPEFYEELRASLPKRGSITLTEGVRDRTGLLTEGMPYGNLASGLGLVEQPEFETAEGESRDADVDVSEFSDETLEILQGVARVLGAETLMEALTEYAELSSMSSEDAVRTIAAVQHDLIDLRNDHLVEEIERALGELDVIVVPWGALHLPGIQQRIRELGFQQSAVTDRRVVSW